MAQAKPGSKIWEPLLIGTWPQASQSHFSDGSAITAGILGRWILLWGMTVAGTGRVPVDWLSEA